MSMTKDDYLMVAGVINLVGYSNSKDLTVQRTLKVLAKELSKQLGQDNPKFDKDKFMQSCGL